MRYISSAQIALLAAALLDSTHTRDTAARESLVAMHRALLATLVIGSHALAPVIQTRRKTVLHSDIIKGSILGEDGITAEVAPQDDDLADPPQTMAQCLQQAQDATVAAIEDGQILMDVEFPPLAADLMDDPNTSAGEISASRRLQE